MSRFAYAQTKSGYRTFLCFHSLAFLWALFWRRLAFPGLCRVTFGIKTAPEVINKSDFFQLWCPKGVQRGQRESRDTKKTQIYMKMERQQSIFEPRVSKSQEYVLTRHVHRKIIFVPLVAPVDGLQKAVFEQSKLT